MTKPKPVKCWGYYSKGGDLIDVQVTRGILINTWGRPEKCEQIIPVLVTPIERKKKHGTK